MKRLCVPFVILLLAACNQAAPPEPSDLAAQATTTVSDQASCEAAGGTYFNSSCEFNDYTVAAGDVLELVGSESLTDVTFSSITNNGTLRVSAFTTSSGPITNTGTVELSGRLRTRSGASTNSGTLTVKNGGRLDLFPSPTLANSGTLEVQGGGRLFISSSATLANTNRVILRCGSSFTNDGTYTGTPPETAADCAGPTVTVNQRDNQADPTTTSPVYFTVSFSETIDETTLAFDDFSVSGTAGAMIIDVAEITRGSVYQLTLGPANDGTIIVSLPADKVTDLAGNPNSASTSTDNTVTYVIPAPIPEPYTIDFEKTAANRLVYSVKVGSGVTYQGQGSASSATVPVVGKRASNGRILEAHVARVVSIYGSKRLIAGSSNTSNMPNATGGRIKLTFTNFDPAGAKLTSITLSNLVKHGAYLTFYYVDGSSSRQNVGTTSAGGSLVVPLSVKNLRALDVYAPNAYAVDDVKFEITPPR